MIEALKYLNEFNYKAGERGISELRGILKIAVMQLTDLMKRWLKGACSSTLTKFPTAETEIEGVISKP